MELSCNTGNTGSTNPYGAVERYLKLNSGYIYASNKQFTVNTAAGGLAFTSVETIGGVTYSNSIFAHAPSDLSFDLGGLYDVFTTKMGVRDYAILGDVTFSVIADGTVIYTSPPVKAGEVIEVSVKVSGVTELRLAANPTHGNPVWDLAVWLNPRLYKSDYRYASMMPFTVIHAAGGMAFPTPMTIRDTVYEHSIFAHAPSELLFNLGGRYTVFATRIGLHEDAILGDVTFRIVADGAVIYTSRPVKGGDVIWVSADVTGVSELRLLADPTHGDPVWDVSAWLNPRFVTSLPSDALVWLVENVGAGGSGGSGGDDAASGGSSSPWRFAGEFFDWETGTYYLRARHFNPRTGRFLSPDPHWTIHAGNMIWGDEPVHLNERKINLLAQQLRTSNPFARHSTTMVPSVHAILQSGNLYMYVMHNPVRLIDPTGLFGVDLFHNCEKGIEGSQFGPGLVRGRAGGPRLRFSMPARPRVNVTNPFRGRLTRGQVRRGQTQNVNVIGIIEVHHQLPRQFQSQFERAGLNIEDFTIPMDKAAHRLKPDGLHTGSDNWNRQWQDFFNANPNAGQDAILEQLRIMQEAFGLE